ncbi:unnamed protein product [Symbiodinium microadriaticum]|nr:unnamed protein product [Symbiodinium microadriaticum]
MLTCRGRTGAALLVRVVRSEKASVVAETLHDALPQHHRAQVRHVVSDSPSAEMHRVLQGVLPGLRSISLDAMHIVMVYEQNMNNKKTSGWLAMIIDKFRKRDPKRSADSWGPFYEGQVLPQPSANVRAMCARLETPDMSYLQAYAHLEQLNPDQPWLTELDFLHAVLAHLSMFREETAKNTYSGATLHRLITNVASPTKLQWLLNDTRYRHSVPRERLVLLPSGTTSNESLHRELNHGFRETAVMHKAALILKLDFFQFANVFARNQALYRPLQRQAGQAEICRRSFSVNVRVMLPMRAWKKWCRNLARPGAIPKKAALRVIQDGKRVRALSTVSSSKTSTRKGKMLAPPLPKGAATRRTPFRLRNVSPSSLFFGQP